jgi:hypothetical protein
MEEASTGVDRAGASRMSFRDRAELREKQEGSGAESPLFCHAAARGLEVPAS